MEEFLFLFWPFPLNNTLMIDVEADIKSYLHMFDFSICRVLNF